MEAAKKYPTVTASVLRALRRKRGYSQEQLGLALGKSRSTISRVERGRRKLSGPEIAKFLRALKSTPAAFSKLLLPLITLERLSEKAVFPVCEAKRSIPANSPTVSDRSTLIEILKTYFKDLPVREVYLFGSVARNEFTSDSDIDLYLQFDEEYKASLFDLSSIKADLSDRTGREVDLVLKGSEYSFLTRNLLRDKIKIHG